jgi:superfamily II DNA or RNA helicase
MTGLREYQKEDLGKIRDHYNKGERRLLGVAATGLGKTKIFSNIYQAIPRKGKMLVIVNREELIDQSVAAIQLANPDLRIGVEQAGNRHSPMDDVVVASIQTIGGVKQDEEGNPDFNKRIMSLDEKEFSVVIVDEAHRSLAKSWIQALKFFKVYKNDPKFNDPEKLLLCLTATPNRADNKGLEEICQNIAFVRDIRWGIENGWLCDIEAYKVNTRVDISSVKISKGDFDNRELSNKINTEQRNGLVVEKYKEIADGKKALFFTMDIEHAKDLADALNKEGIKAAAVYSGMGKNDRKAIFSAHKSGKIAALTGANIFLEGYDDPTIEVICMVRPTKSNVLYTQAIGRGLRPSPNREKLEEMQRRGETPSWIKPSCIVIDFVDVSSKHTLITVPTLFGLNANLDMKGKKALKTLQELEEQIAKVPAHKKGLIELDKFDDLTKLTGHIERIDLLSTPQTPDEIKGYTELSWVKAGGSYILSTPEDTYTVTENTLGTYSIYSGKKGIQQFLGVSTDFKEALKKVESRLNTNQYQFSKRDAGWRKDPPTAAQVNLLCKIDRNGVSMFRSKEDYAQNIMKSFTKWQASSKITELMASRSR